MVSKLNASMGACATRVSPEMKWSAVRNGPLQGDLALPREHEASEESDNKETDMLPPDALRIEQERVRTLLPPSPTSKRSQSVSGPSPGHGTPDTAPPTPETRRMSHAAVMMPHGNTSPAAQRRRRLSVSTVDGNKAPMPARTNLMKFNDPALELIDRRRGTVREVTLHMLKSLFPDAEHYAVFGSPSYDLQRGFDNKALETGGIMPEGKSLADIGVAYACKKGLKPESPNQDDFFVIRVDDWAIYGVFDGHGPYGHEISAFVHKTLPFLIISDPFFETDLPATLKRAFWRAHHLVEAACEQPDSVIDCSLSGTTATVLVQRDNQLTVAYVGDSRCVLGRKREGRLTAVNLTFDHKPTNPSEMSRIEASGGEVRRLDGDVPYRVFVRDRMYPGLAMSRAIGDLVGAVVGVVPEPDIHVYDIQNDDRLCILASDGVWEFISSQQAIEIVAQRKPHLVNEGAELLAYESWKRWVEEEENVVDDVTCILIWLQPPKSRGPK